MDNINDLIGDAAKQLMAQADGIQNQKLKASAQRVARTVSAKTRDELISVARSDAYGRDTRFIKYLPITWRQKAVPVADAVHNLSYLLDTPIAIRVREKRGKGLEG